MKKGTHRCLYCYKPLEEGLTDFHPRCYKGFFGTSAPPVLSLDKEKIRELANTIVSKSIAIPGVQPKLSLSLKVNKNDPKKSRLTIVGLWGEYILKPQSEVYESLPENEDLTMHLARLSGIEIARHRLLRTDTGELVYITKRFDREKGKKIAVEDLCQLMGKLTTDKYESTMEKAGKAIARYSSVSGIDVIRFFDVVVFSFLTGNSDMHLKNFSIIKAKDNLYRLSPAYDLVSSNIALENDKEQIALHLNGKKNNVKKKDFMALAETLGIQGKMVERIFTKYHGKVKEFEECISTSFLPDELKKRYASLYKSRMGILK